MRSKISPPYFALVGGMYDIVLSLARFGGLGVAIHHIEASNQTVRGAIWALDNGWGGASQYETKWC